MVSWRTFPFRRFCFDAALLALLAAGVCATLASRAWATTGFVHIVLVDVSGSMDSFLADEQIRRWFHDAILTNQKLILPGESLIVRGFNAHLGAPTFRVDDPLRFWPPGGETKPFTDAVAMQSAAGQIMPSIKATDQDTDLSQALRHARADWTEMAKGAPSIVWMITDNWQDVGGNAAGLDSFYADLATDEVVRGISLLPLLRSRESIADNLVLYAFLFASEVTEAQVGEYEGRVDQVAEASRGRSFLDESLTSITCRGSQLQPPVMDSVKYEPGAGCDAEMSTTPGSLDFQGLSLGSPLNGRLQFRLRSTTRQWRIHGAEVTSLRFSSFTPVGGDIDCPLAVPIRVTPPTLEDVGPGDITKVRFQAVFPEEGVLRPELRSRTFRQFFPGSDFLVRGRVSLGIAIDLSKQQLVLDDQELAELVGQVRMIDGIGRLVSNAPRQEPVVLSKAYPVSVQVRVNDGVSWVGPISLIALFVLGLAGGVWLLLPGVYLVRLADGEDREGKATMLRPAEVKVDGTTVGRVRRTFDGSLWFHPILRDSSEGELRKVRLGTSLREILVAVKRGEVRKIKIGKRPRG